MDENVEYTKMSIKSVYALARHCDRMAVCYPAKQAIAVFTHDGWYVFFTTLHGTAYHKTDVPLVPFHTPNQGDSNNETSDPYAWQKGMAVDDTVSRLLHTPPGSLAARCDESTGIWVLPTGFC